MQHRVLIAARDVGLRAGLARILGPAGYAVELAEGPTRASEIMAARKVALAIVEPTGFGKAGLDLTREARKTVGTLIVIAGNAREIEELKQKGVRADAYVLKPIAPELVLDRVNELLSKPHGRDVLTGTATVLRFGGFALDLAGRSLHDPSGQNVALTAAQFRLLETLARHRGRVLSRDQISEAVGARQTTPYDRSIDVLISRLRQKIEVDPKAPRLIITVPGAGYKFAGKPQVVTATELVPDFVGQNVEPAPSAKPRIGLIPFKPLGTDQNCALCAQALSEDLITAFLQSGLAVSQLRSIDDQNALDLQRIAQEFAVHYLVAGNIRNTGETLRATAQLIQGATGTHLWAERFELSISDFPALHDVVSEKIAAGVSGILCNDRGDRVWPRDLERRQLTIISADFVDLANLATALDPEDLRALMISLHRCCTETIDRFGGIVATFTGDLMLACFGYPQAKEGDAEQAVSAGLELLNAIGRLGGRCGRLRLGIATGPTVVGDLIGRDDPKHPGVFGETRKLASALRQIAEPNTVSISARTRSLIGRLFDCRERKVDLEGDDNSAWEVLGPSSVVSRFEALHGSPLTPMVGREEEVQVLHRHWRDAKSGEMRVVLVTGEPGIGKSRLAAALQDRLGAEQYICFRFFSSPHRQDNAFYPIIRHLEAAAGFELNDTAETRQAKLSALLAPAALSGQDLLLLAELVGLPPQSGLEQIKASPRLKREMMFDALIRQFDARSSQSPVLMIFEDAHWSDPTSCELLDLAIARLASRPVLLLITFRPEFESPWTGRAHVTTLTLSRLPRRQSAELIGRVVGDDVLSSDIVGEIVERTDGIPLFLEELSKAVIEANRSSTSSGSGATRQATLAIPATLQASLIARLDRLDPAAKEVAQIGAAVGREFSHELVAAVAGRPDSEVAEGLEGLVKSGLAFGRGAPPDAIFLFKHALVRDAAYSMLPRRKSRQLHGRIATVLEHRFADVVERLPAVVAHHCSEAGFTLRAIAYWGKAGRKSIAQSAMLEAVAQLRKGLDLLATLPNNAERWRQELELQTALAAALLASRGHGSPEVGEVYVRARALAERLGDAAGLAPILSGQFSFHLQRSEYAAGRQIAERLLQLDDGQGDPVGGVVGHRAMGVCTHQLGDFASAAAHFEQVLNLYIPDLHQSVAAVAGFDPRAAALRYLAFGQFIRGYSDQALSNMTEMMRWSRTLGHLYVMVHALNWTASFHLLRGDLQSALTPLEELLQLAEQKFPLWLALGQINRGLLLAKAGEPHDGLALGRRGFNAMMAIGSTWNQPYYKGMLARTCELAGRPDEAMDELVTALAIVEQTGERWFAPELHRALGDWFIQHRPSAHAQAEEQFQSAMALAQEQNAKRWELRAATSLSRLRRDQGRHVEAYTLLAPLCAWFSEGRDLPDLRAGTALLQELEQFLPARRAAYGRSAEGSRARGNRREARRR